MFGITGQLTRYGLLSEALLLIAETPDLERLLSGATNKLKWVGVGLVWKI